MPTTRRLPSFERRCTWPRRRRRARPGRRMAALAALAGRRRGRREEEGTAPSPARRSGAERAGCRVLICGQRRRLRRLPRRAAGRQRRAGRRRWHRRTRPRGPTDARVRHTLTATATAAPNDLRLFRLARLCKCFEKLTSVFASEFSHLEYDEREWETINYLFDHSGGEVTFDNLDVRSLLHRKAFSADVLAEDLGMVFAQSHNIACPRVAAQDRQRRAAARAANRPRSAGAGGGAAAAAAPQAGGQAGQGAAASAAQAGVGSGSRYSWVGQRTLPIAANLQGRRRLGSARGSRPPAAAALPQPQPQRRPSTAPSRRRGGADASPRNRRQSPAPSGQRGSMYDAVFG